MQAELKRLEERIYAPGRRRSRGDGGWQPAGGLGDEAAG